MSKHRSVVYLKALMPLLGDDEPDWDTIEELFVHASVHINNSIAAFKGNLKQVVLPFTNLSDNKPATPKTAEAVFSCTFCGTFGPKSLGDGHTCDEGEMHLLLRDNRCEVCGGYVSGADLVPVVGADWIGVKHNDPALCELQADGPITDETKQLPALVKCNAPNCETPAEMGKHYLCDAHTVHGFVCLNCGDTFLNRAMREAHLRQAHQVTSVSLEAGSIQVALFIYGSYHTVDVFGGVYFLSELKKALRLPEESEVWAGLYDESFDNCMLSERLTEKATYDLTAFALIDGWAGTQVIKGDKSYQCENCHDVFLGDEIAIVTELGPRCDDCKKKLEEPQEEAAPKALTAKPETTANPEPSPNKYVMTKESRQALGEATTQKGKKAAKKKTSEAPAAEPIH